LPNRKNRFSLYVFFYFYFFFKNHLNFDKKIDKLIAPNLNVKKILPNLV
jgi:hypothetical protein